MVALYSLQQLWRKWMVMSLVSSLLMDMTTTAQETTHHNSGSSINLIADVIVVGSGPGGTGFLWRLTQIQTDLSVLWFEKGPDKIARNWPEDVVANEDVLLRVPRSDSRFLDAIAWNAFGGGDAFNSGGPVTLGIDLSRSQADQVYQPVDVRALRNHSITPLNLSSRRWMQAFQETGRYNVVEPCLNRRDLNVSSLGQVSTLQSEDGRQDRLLLAQKLRDDPNNNITYVHARIDKILHDEATGRATGVQGVLLADNQEEILPVITWTAKRAIVIAAGVFGTFDLLIKSGIGPAEFLEARNVSQPWWSPNENVGQGVGDEAAALALFVEPEVQDALGAEAILTVNTDHGAAMSLWNSGTLSVLTIRDSRSSLLYGTVIPAYFPKVNQALQNLFNSTSFWGIGLPTKPVMSLRAVKKSFQNPLGRTNPQGVVLDDSKLAFTDEMCQALLNALPPIRRGFELQEQANQQQSRAKLKLDLASTSGAFKLIRPIPITRQNIGKFSKRDCKLDVLASYYHFYGGNAKVIDGSYRVQGTKGLYISDASVFSSLAAGAPSTTVMQEGMRVADAFSADILSAFI